MVVRAVVHRVVFIRVVRLLLVREIMVVTQTTQTPLLLHLAVVEGHSLQVVQRLSTEAHRVHLVWAVQAHRRALLVCQSLALVAEEEQLEQLVKRLRLGLVGREVAELVVRPKQQQVEMERTIRGLAGVQRHCLLFLEMVEKELLLLPTQLHHQH
jgi:hypothetical protein